MSQTFSDAYAQSSVLGGQAGSGSGSVPSPSLGAPIQTPVPALTPADHVPKIDPEGFPVAIIGAGVTGLSCGQELKRSGVQAVLFDKARAPGGRITTRRRDDFEWDMGAQMITANSREFMAQMREWQFRGLARRWRGRFSGPDIGQKNDGPFYVGLPRMGELARSLARGLDVRYPVQISALTRDPYTGLWRLFDEHGADQGQFRAVLCTLPRQQTLALYDQFIEMRNGLRMCGDLVPTWSVYVVFRKRFDVPFDGRTFDTGPLKSIFRNNAKPERADEPECWVLNANPELSAQFIDYPGENVVSDLIAALEFSVEKKLPPVVEARAHRWLYALPVGQAGFRSQYDNRIRLGFGGDWVQPPRDQFGGVEAAFLSGRALAQQARTLLP